MVANSHRERAPYGRETEREREKLITFSDSSQLRYHIVSLGTRQHFRAYVPNWTSQLLKASTCFHDEPVGHFAIQRFVSFLPRRNTSFVEAIDPHCWPLRFLYIAYSFSSSYVLCFSVCLSACLSFCLSVVLSFCLPLVYLMLSRRTRRSFRYPAIHVVSSMLKTSFVCLLSLSFCSSFRLSFFLSVFSVIFVSVSLFFSCLLCSYPFYS